MIKLDKPNVGPDLGPSGLTERQSKIFSQNPAPSLFKLGGSLTSCNQLENFFNKNPGQTDKMTNRDGNLFDRNFIPCIDMGTYESCCHVKLVKYLSKKISVKKLLWNISLEVQKSFPTTFFCGSFLGFGRCLPEFFFFKFLFFE